MYFKLTHTILNLHNFFIQYIYIVSLHATYTHVHAHEHARHMQARTCMHTHVHNTLAHAHALTCICAHTHACMCTLAWMHVHTCMAHMRACMCAVRMQTCMHIIYFIFPIFTIIILYFSKKSADK